VQIIVRYLAALLELPGTECVLPVFKVESEHFTPAYLPLQLLWQLGVERLGATGHEKKDSENAILEPEFDGFDMTTSFSGHRSLALVSSLGAERQLLRSVLSTVSNSCRRLAARAGA